MSSVTCFDIFVSGPVKLSLVYFLKSDI